MKVKGSKVTVNVNDFEVPGMVPDGVEDDSVKENRIILRVEGVVDADNNLVPDVVQPWREHDVHAAARDQLREEVLGNGEPPQ